MKVIMGVDVSSTDLEVNVLTESGISSSKQFANTKPGCRKLIAYAEKHEVSCVVMEATGGYEQLLAKEASSAQLDVKIVNPAQVRNFAKGIGKIAKTDRIDAYVIARFAQVVELPDSFSRTEEELILRKLVQRRIGLNKIIEAEKNRRKLAESFEKQSIDRVLKALNKEIVRIDWELDEIISNSDVLNAKRELLCTQKGVGNLTATILIALIPELGYINRKQVAALAGLAPIARDSGKMKGKRFISGGRFGPRKALYMPAWVAVQNDNEFREFYDKLISKGKKPKVAIVAVMRRLLVKLNGMMYDNFVKMSEQTI